MSRNNLTKRLELLGVDLAQARRPAAPAATVPGAVPIRAAPTKRAPVRVLPAHEALLREAKFDLMARYRVDTDEGAVLATFIAEAFPAWLAGKLAAKH
jgi:hypothetical protein